MYTRSRIFQSGEAHESFAVRCGKRVLLFRMARERVPVVFVRRCQGCAHRTVQCPTRFNETPNRLEVQGDATKVLSARAGALS